MPTYKAVYNGNRLYHFNKNHDRLGRFDTGDGDGDGISNDHKNQRLSKQDLQRENKKLYRSMRIHGINAATIYDKKSKFIDNPVLADITKDERLVKAHKKLSVASKEDDKYQPSPYDYPDLLNKTIKEYIKHVGSKPNIKDENDMEAFEEFLYNNAFNHNKYMSDTEKFEKRASKWSDAYLEYTNEIDRVTKEFTGKYANKKMDPYISGFTYSSAVNILINEYELKKIYDKAPKHSVDTYDPFTKKHEEALSKALKSF